MDKQPSERAKPGRRPFYGEGNELNAKINIRLSAEEKAFLISVGGSDWIRDRIRHASELDCPGPGFKKGLPKDQRFQARMLPQDVARFKNLGGSKWLRHQVHNAMKESTPSTTPHTSR